MIGANLVLVCQITDCDAVETIEILPPPTERVIELMDEYAPEWGWDVAGLNTVLHCPEHRALKSAHQEAHEPEEPTE